MGGVAVDRLFGADSLAPRVFGSVDLISLISEFCPDVSLDATCRAVKEARKQVGRYSLSREGTETFLTKLERRSGILNRVHSSKMQLSGTFSFDIDQLDLDSLREKTKHFANFKLTIFSLGSENFPHINHLDFLNLTQLELFHLDSFDPDILKYAVNLESLELVDVDEVTLNLANLKKLKDLELVYVNHFGMPDDENRGSASLERIAIYYCDTDHPLDLEMFLGSMPQLRKLLNRFMKHAVRGRLNQIFPALVEAELEDIDHASLQSLGGCPNLKQLEVRGKYLNFLPPLESLIVNLGSATAEEARLLQSLKTENLTSLRLCFDSMTNLEFARNVVNALAKMQGLRTLRITTPGHICCDSFRSLKQLERIYFDEAVLDNIDALLELPNLRAVHVDSSCKLCLEQLHCFTDSPLFVSPAKITN